MTCLLYITHAYGFIDRDKIFRNIKNQDIIKRREKTEFVQSSIIKRQTREMSSKISFENSIYAQ